MDKKSNNPIEILKKDHEVIKKLLNNVLESKNKSKKEGLFKELYHRLDVHAKIEEEIFYKALELNKKTHIKTLEAYEEHNIVKLMLNELNLMPKEDEQFDAKFQVFTEVLKHHIKEEESELLPTSKGSLSKEELEELGEKMKIIKDTMDELFVKYFNLILLRIVLLL